MKHLLTAALLVSLLLATPGIAADKKAGKKRSTLPPTSPMLVVPKTDATPSEDAASGKLINSEMSGLDLAFFMKAVEAGREQAFLVDLLKKSASSPEIKKLADDLGGAPDDENMHIAKLAAQKGLTVSLEPTAAQRKGAEEFAKLSGSNFDKAVMDKVAAANAQSEKAYQGAAQLTDPQTKTFAAQMLPLAEQKRHIVEKMTGAGSRTANQLFRHGGVSQGTPAPATPSGKSTPAASPKGKVTPAPKK